MCRMTNAGSWDSVQNLCLAIKSMFSTTSCVCVNLGSLKIHIRLKIAITCFSDTCFIYRIISALYIWHTHIKAGKVYKLHCDRNLKPFLTPVSYRSSRHRLQWKRLLLKMPNDLVASGRHKMAAEEYDKTHFVLCWTSKLRLFRLTLQNTLMLPFAFGS